jgi:hypothetical protein
VRVELPGGVVLEAKQVKVRGPDNVVLTLTEQPDGRFNAEQRTDP